MEVGHWVSWKEMCAYCLCYIEMSRRFLVQPESVVQAEGLGAVFKCLYHEALSYTWSINGEFLPDNQFPPDWTRVPPLMGIFPARLIIPAASQYNNTVVQCVVVFVEEGGDFMSLLSRPLYW